MWIEKKTTAAIAFGLSVLMMPGTAAAFNDVFAPHKVGAQLVYSADYTLVQGYHEGRDQGQKNAGPETRWQDMPPEVKEKIRQKIEDRFGHLTPEQRAEKLEELRRRREELRRELENLPPAERKARMEELKRQFQQKHKDSVH